MVNTFVTSTSFRQSAENLTGYHLNKQITEAYQIRRACEGIHLLARWYNWKVPTNPYDFWDFRKDLIRKYEKEDFRLIYQIPKNKFDKIYKEGKTYPKMRKQSVFEEIVDENEHEVTLKNLNNNKLIQVPTNLFVGLDELYLTKGYKYHPAILMWLNYESALEYYINCCIQEQISRGGNSRIPLYDVSKNVEKPAWVFDPDFRRRNCANLLRKEYEFKDKKWHQRLPHKQRHYYRNRFGSHNPTEAYFWPYSQNYDKEQRYK